MIGYLLIIEKPIEEDAQCPLLVAISFDSLFLCNSPVGSGTSGL
jgi:hypothetical protein